jgi:UDP-glucose 4-epimerase
LGIDNFDPYYPKDYKLLRLKEILENPNFEFYEVDFSDKGRLRGVFEKGGISGILHIGAKAGVRASIRDPESYIKANVIGTLNIFGSYGRVRNKEDPYGFNIIHIRGT